MLKKLFVVVFISVFICSGYSFGAQEEEAELSSQQEQMQALAKEIKALKKKLTEVKQEYVKAEKKLQKEIAEKTAALPGKRQKIDRKEILGESKEKQAQLRKDYYQKKKPLADEMNGLKVAHRKCKNRIKSLEKRIDKIKEGRGPDYVYMEQIKDLKQELAELKSEFKKGLAKLQNETDEKVASLSNKESKATAKKQILSEAKDEELKLRGDYAEKKEVIAAKIHKAKLAHRERMKQRQEQVRKERRVQSAQEDQGDESQAITSTRYNFGPAK